MWHVSDRVLAWVASPFDAIGPSSWTELLALCTFAMMWGDPETEYADYEATILYLVRERGRLRVETDRWTLGLFSAETWRSTIRDAGFAVRETVYDADGDAYRTFVAVRSG